MDDDDDFVESDFGDHSPDDDGESAIGHGYDAVFFIVAIVTAIVFIVALYYFRG